MDALALTDEWLNRVAAEVNDILDGDYAVSGDEGIPSLGQVGHGKVARKASLCAFAIDLRDSSELLDNHHRQTAGKIHKAFLRVTASAIKEGGGYVRSFNGDGLLAFWPATEAEEIQQAVDTAVELNLALRMHLMSEFAKYRPIDFGIGIDYGDVFVVRAGIKGGQRDSDLVFIGPCVNFASRMAKQARAPRSVRVSPNVHANLRPEQKYADPGAWLLKEPYWETCSTEHKDRTFETYARSDPVREIILSFG